MSGNSIGVLFRVTTWGESHGKAVGVVVDGCPPRLPLTESDIQKELKRRKPGQIPSASPRREEDLVEILSGTFEGRTTGTPISLVIKNRDVDSAAYEELRDIFRPGQGDYTYYKKYGIRDHRGGGRASARETAARVAAGAIAKKVIATEGIEVIAYTKELGGIAAERISPAEIHQNRLQCPDLKTAQTMAEKLEEVKENGDSLGGIVEIRVKGCPPGLGEPVFDKLDADLAKALMSIGTVKGVEIGAGFQAARMTGFECNDPIRPEGFSTNHAGGILAGITNGEEILIRVACKPIPSIARTQKTIDIHGNPREVSIEGRHDVSAIPRIVSVCEAMVTIVLADHLLRQRANAFNDPGP
ncbi:MAG: chorismate synthase [Proteobacteria bacterium]|nr:chorismate synthase [Pseudomonadota bacterium]